MELRKQYIVYIPFLFLLAFVFILFNCDVSSPLTFKYFGDSSIFMAMGKMFLEGKVPYVDFFDHKGPSFILLEAFGQILAPGRLGIFFLEVLNLFFVLVFISKIAGLLLDKKRKILLCLIFLIFSSRIISRGNTTEEFSLIPLFISLFLVCKYYFKTKEISVMDGFLLGICFSFLFWMRMNNAGAIVAICVFIFISTIIDRDYVSLKKLILFFCLGQLPLSLLYIVYFSYHGALYDLMYANFIFNFRYVNSFLSFEGEAFWVNVVVLIVLVIGSILHYRKEKDYKIFIFTTLLFFFSFITINIGYAFTHYFILICPAFVFGCLLILNSIDNDKLIKGGLLLAAIAFLGLLSRSAYYIIKEGESFKLEAANYKKHVYALIDQIPEEDRDKIYYYMVDVNFYVLADISANHKYFALQEWHGLHDESVFHEINEMMRSTPPPYVMLPKDRKSLFEGKEYANPEFTQILRNNYNLFVENDDFIILKLL
ncbi:hypothetical protein [Dysgonomonas sp. ZJ279]|uniref:hypothetical protein n=1 Tax=Dysgonomonas sp. ZJ279 TaxID=2709796 RepID=UPI0013EBE727|nr:hypothetical protein [Dysgonomonas sp. ZJ279]